jgi:hypothetical protein
MNNGTGKIAQQWIYAKFSHFKSCKSSVELKMLGESLSGALMVSEIMSGINEKPFLDYVKR